MTSFMNNIKGKRSGLKARQKEQLSDTKDLTNQQLEAASVLLNVPPVQYLALQALSSDNREDETEIDGEIFGGRRGKIPNFFF